MVIGVVSEGKASSSLLGSLGIASQIVAIFEQVRGSIKKHKDQGLPTEDAALMALAEQTNKRREELQAQYNANGIDSAGFFHTFAQFLDDGKADSASDMNNALALSENANRSPALTMLLVGAAALLLLPALGIFGTKRGRRFAGRQVSRFRAHRAARRARPRRPRRSFRRSFR